MEPEKAPEDSYERAVRDALARVVPDARIDRAGPGRLAVALPDGRRLVLAVGEAARAFRDTDAGEAELPRAAKAYVQHSLLAREPVSDAPPGQEPFTDARDRILPLLESAAFFDRTREQAPEAPALLRFPVRAGDLEVALVLPGEGRSMRFLSRRDADRWAVPPEGLEHQALRNLDRHVRGRLSLTLRHGVYCVVSETPWFQASLALLASVRLRLAEVLGPTPRVALPGRDVLVAFGADEEEAWRPLRARMRERYERDAHPLSPELLEATAGGLRRLEAL